MTSDLAPPTGLCFQNVWKTYRQAGREINALSGIDLEIPQGRFTAVMGASGSGKSTLLHLCALLDAPSRGRIIINGRDLSGLTEKQATEFRRRQVGVIFQQYNLLPSLTVRENILLPARLAGLYDRSIDRRAEELIDNLGLSGRALHRPDSLSGGEQQRSAIARALILEPPILLADEPTGNLDSVNGELFWKLLKQSTARIPITILLVTHEAAAALQAQCVVVLRDGRVAGSFSVEDHENAGNLAARYQQLAH
jgi:putative ABC transport system ATP-binding protein